MKRKNGIKQKRRGKTRSGIGRKEKKKSEDRKATSEWKEATQKVFMFIILLTKAWHQNSFWLAMDEK